MNLEIVDAPRVGRDPNDASWVIVRYAADFPPAGPGAPPGDVKLLRHLDYDPKRGVLELEPMSLRFPDGREWLPLEPVADASGRRYRSDPDADRILTAAPCSDEFVPVPGIGGPGFHTGEVDRPLGLSLDHRGWLVVADSDNHRVQIFDGSAVVIVLGRTDAWGRPLAGTSGGAMTEPTHAVIDPTTCLVFVADRGAGLIHVFDARFRYLRSFPPRTSEPRPPGKPARPAALSLQPDGSLLVLDTSWPRVLHFTAEGEPLAELNLSEAPDPAWAALVKRRRYAAKGEALIGPLDGGRYDTAWHRVVVEATFPPGTTATVQTFATNDGALDPSRIAWAPPAPVPLPGPASSESEPGSFSRLVVSDTEAWTRWRYGPYARAYPELARFAGNGPNGVNQLRLPAAALPMIRAGDTLRIVDAGGSGEPAVLSALPPVAVTFSGSGSARVYATAATLAVGERDGETIPVEPRTIYRLAAGETIDLSAWDPQADETTVNFPHAAAAWLRTGDVISIATGADRADLQISDILWADTTVTLTAPVSHDFSTSQVVLFSTPGRLFIDDLRGFETLLPAAEPFTVASDTGTLAVQASWEEKDIGAIWLEPGLTGTVVTYENWQSVEAPAPVATDKGQFLWILLRVEGLLEHPASSLSVDTPSIRSIRALLPRLSYLQYLPRLFSRRDEQIDASGALFLERFLALFEERLTRIEASYEQVSRELNPLAASPDWLLFLGGWLNLVFDPSWDDARRRQLIAAAADLFRIRGTREGMSRYIEIYTGRRPEILEGYQVRPSEPLIVGRTGTLGSSPLRFGSRGGGQGAAASFTAHAHRFTLFVFFDDACDFEVKQSAVRSIVETTKPAHTEYSLCFVTPETRVGLQSTVGLDMMLGGPDTGGFALGRDPSPLDRRKQPLVGYDRIGSSNTGTRPALRIEQGGQRIDRGFSLG